MILRPYDETRLLPYEVVQHFPAEPADPRTLIPTQEFLSIERLLALLAGAPAEGPDPCPHVVAYQGGRYVHNGHHRWMIDLIRGAPIDVRVQAAR